MKVKGKPNRIRRVQMAKNQRRRQQISKTLMTTAQLIESMEEHLPIPAYAGKELRELLRSKGKDISRGTELQIDKVFDSGDTGGIMCSIIEEDSEVYIVSLTHLMIKPGHPLHSMIKTYQRRRIRKLARQNI
jgi:hypothetical protein